MTGMGRPPLWFYTTTHGPRTKESQVSQPRGRGAGQWPAAGGATHSTHSTQRKRARARARWGSLTHTATPRRRTACVLPVFGARAGCAEGARLASNGGCRAEQASRESDEEATRARQERDTTKTRRRPQRRGGDRECDERRSCAARSTHARRTSRLPEADSRARLACRERGGGVAASALVERSGAKRSDDRNATPPASENTYPAHSA